MPSVTPDETTRNTILRALNMLIEGTNIEEANDVLRHLEVQYHKSPPIFSLDSLFFGGIITATLDREFQSQIPSLIQIRDELTGKQPHWKTYALKYDFRLLFSSEMHEAFQWILELDGRRTSPAI